MTVRILLVEDGPDDVALTREAFSESRLPHELLVARDGIEALDFLHRRGEFAEAPRPDLILLDLNLPRKDGWEVLAELKAEPELQGIPVVILTTSRSEADYRRAARLGADLYLAKPVDFEHFLDVLAQVERFWSERLTRQPRADGPHPPPAARC